MVGTTTLSASTIRDVFDLPEEEAQSGYRYGPGTVRGDLAEDFEVVRHARERHRGRVWSRVSVDGSDGMFVWKQKELIGELLEAERHIEAVVKGLRG
jgi:hypothetical protein